MTSLKCLLLSRPSIAKGISLSRSVNSRLLEPLTYLQSTGLIRLDIKFEDDIALESTINNYDVLFISKSRSKKILDLVVLCNSLGKIIYYDIDELITSYPDFSNVKISDQEMKLVSDICYNSTFVAFSNVRLKSELDFLDNSNKVIIPTGFTFNQSDLTLVSTAKVNSVKKFVLVNGDNLKISLFKSDFIKVINDFFKSNFENTTLDLISEVDLSSSFSSANIRHLGAMDWLTYKNHLKHEGYHFAIIPLGGVEEGKNLRYNSCKTPVKFIEYSASGIIGIYSNTPLYSDYVTNGENGFLVDNNVESWSFALNSAIGMSNEERKRLVVNTFNTAQENFEISKVANQIFNLVKTR